MTTEKAFEVVGQLVNLETLDLEHNAYQIQTSVFKCTVEVLL